MPCDNTCFGHISSELARDSVILLVSAPKLARIYLFTSSHLRYKGNEAKKRLKLSGTVQIRVVRSVNTVERKI